MINKSNLIKFGSAILTSLFIASCDGGSDDSTTGPTSVTLNVSFEASGPIGFSSSFFFIHSGNLDLFDNGNILADDLTELVELGGVASLLNGTTLADGVFDNGRFVLEIAPGDIASSPDRIGNLVVSMENRYFTYFTTANPSNDTFSGNDNPLEFDLYQMILDSPDGTVTIEVTELYDAGTEVNDFLTSDGNEFIAGLPEGDPEAGEDENGVITLHTPTFYDEYLNPGDFDVSTLNPNGAVVARITITIEEQ